MSGEEMIKLSTAVYKKHFSQYINLREDLIQSGCLGIIQGIEKFDEEKGAESTYLWKCAKIQMIRFLKSENKANCVSKNLDIDNMAIQNYDFDSRLELKMFKEKTIALCYGFSLTEKIIVKCILNGDKQCEIAKKLNLSRQFVNQTYQKMKKRAQEHYYYENGLVEKEKNGKL